MEVLVRERISFIPIRKGENMKIIKRIIITIVTLVLVIGGLYYVTPRNAVAASDFSITSPKNGSLKAAGLMDITWESASDLGEVKSYDVFIDGSLVKNTTETKYEYYTTKVYYHKVWIRANFTNGTNHYSKTVRFGVTKKGLGTETGMGCWNLKTKEMGIAWYYNWGRGSYSYSANFEDLEYVPMIWGTSQDQNASVIQNKMQAAVNEGSKYILGFNEPDMGGSGGGCNMPTNKVIGLWPNFLGYNIKVGSPAYAMWSDVSSSEFPTFMAGVENKVDFVCVHCYPANWDGGYSMAIWFLNHVVDDTYKRYHKPIWITEYSTSGDNITQSGTASFIEFLFPELDERDYVVRQAWFPFDAAKKGGGLYYYSSGELTLAGRTFAKYGNPEKDYVTGNYRNPRDPVPTTKPTVKPTTKPSKPAKVKISKAKYKKKRKIYIKLKKVSGAKGYQIRYSDNKHFDGYWTKSIKKTTVTLKKLDKNTKYYIKARAYKLVNKTKLYGKWSKVKTIKVKK